MPSLRSQSNPPATPLASTPAAKLRSSSSTPKHHCSSTVQSSTHSPTPSIATVIASHHHQTSDDLAIVEAAKLLQMTPNALLHDVVESPGGASPRDVRHRRLIALRNEETFENSLQDEGDVIVVREDSRYEYQNKDETAGEDFEISKPDDTAENRDSERPETGNSNDEDQENQEEVTTISYSTADTSNPSVTLDDDSYREKSATPVPVTVSIAESDAESMSESSESDLSESDSETSVSLESDDESDDEVVLGRLLQAARASALAQDKASAGDSSVQTSDKVQEAEDELRFDGDEGFDQRKKERPIPNMSIPPLPTPHISFRADGTARASVSTPPIIAQNGESSKSQRSGGKQGSEARKVPELDTRRYERELSKKERAAQPKKATTSELWATLPSSRADLLPQMRRDYQALALANSLDPKRFMKGGNKAGKIPENFAIGTVVEPPRHLRDTTLTRERKYRPGQVVENLVADGEIGSYAKRKYGDLQGVRMDNGRGKGWKKRSKW